MISAKIMPFLSVFILYIYYVYIYIVFAFFLFAYIKNFHYLCAGIQKIEP